VIGAGLTGLSVAYHLLSEQPNRQVIILEANQVGSGASTRSTGMITPGVGQNLTALVNRVGRDHARALYQETLQAVRYVRQLVERENIDCQLQMGGQLIIAQGRQGPSRLATLANLLETLDLPCERLDEDTLARTVRLLSSTGSSDSSLPAALCLPVAGTLHPGLLLKGLVQCIQQRGGEIYEQAQVLGISKTQPTILQLATGKVIADQVILATGGYTPMTGTLRGRILPVHLHALATEPLEPAALQTLGWTGRECIIDSRRLFNYYRLTADNRIVFGGRIPRYYWGGRTTDVAGENRLNSLLREFQQIFGREVNVATHWTGVIDYVLDAMPVIGRLRDYPTVLYVGGWCGHGIALSISAGKWVAHLLRYGEPPQELPWFRDCPPLLPSELLRWVGFGVVVNLMAYQDRN
jgi:gamma-glutamylputrescine oxidase